MLKISKVHNFSFKANSLIKFPFKMYFLVFHYKRISFCVNASHCKDYTGFFVAKQKSLNLLVCANFNSRLKILSLTRMIIIVAEYQNLSYLILARINFLSVNLKVKQLLTLVISMLWCNFGLFLQWQWLLSLGGIKFII